MAGSATNQRLEKNAREKKVVALLRYRSRCAVVLLGAALLSLGAGSAVDTLQQLQQRFDRENDAVRKAKQLRKLASAQFDNERESAKSGDYSGVGLEMEKYRDNVRAALEALKKAHPDAEKHSAGYRELEMQVGQGIREIRDVILAVPEQFRPPMQLVEEDLKKMDTELLRLLFPRRPGEKPAPPAARTDNPPNPAEAMGKQP
jgi:hypothetical protein